MPAMRAQLPELVRELVHVAMTLGVLVGLGANGLGAVLLQGNQLTVALRLAGNGEFDDILVNIIKITKSNRIPILLPWSLIAVDHE